MATTSKSGAKKPSATTRKTAPKEEPSTKVEKAVPEKTAAKTECVENKRMIPTEVDPDQFIPVYNGYQGRLLYRSPRTKELFVWPEFGSEQVIELKELRIAKNTYKSFFTNNWFMFDDDYMWVVDYLGMSQFYQNAIDIRDFDDLFVKSPDEIKEIVGKLSFGQKQSVGYRARQLMAEDGIDSKKVIAALEESLNIELIER